MFLSNYLSLFSSLGNFQASPCTSCIILFV
uniref:Uncharacterized protein n=1 Tax=Arundo donax TaxID=35708 RepID=A0A0A9CBL3_ARUDO